MATDDTSTDTPAGAASKPGQAEWLSTKEAARRLGITARTLYRFIDEGDLPAYRFGRVIRLKPADIDAYVESCRIEPGTLEHLYPEANSPSAQP
jgi:excisionase family DNA binding protein